MSTDPKIKQTDAGLSRYYKQLNRTDYFDDDNNGKFAIFCEENGLGDDDLLDEMQTDPSQSMLVEFDDDFPFMVEPKADNRNNEISKVIKTCYEDIDAFKVSIKYAAMEINRNDFEIDSKEVEDLSVIFKNECRTIFDKGFDNDRDRVLMNTLYIGNKKMNNTPYLQLICDLYARDRLRHYLQIKVLGKKVNKLKPTEWALLNKHTLKIRNFSKNRKEFNSLKSAIDTYYKRICPLMGLAAQIKIHDSYEQICEYISGAVDFVHNIAHKEQSCPFQYDCCFAFNEVTMDSDKHTKVDHGNANDTKDDDSDDSDDDDDDVDDMKHAEAEEDKYFYDCFGNIKKRLRSERIVFVTEQQINNNVSDPDSKSSKRFKEQYKKFKQKLQSKHNMKEFEQYPRRFRFISILDRREATDDNKEKEISEQDELIFLEPTSDCYKLPKDQQCDNLWYFNSSKTCIIPKIGYNKENYTSYDEKEEHEFDARREDKENMQNIDNGTKYKLQTQTINTDHPMKNALFVLSFHVYSEDEIRCYMYLGGCMMRFFADDLHDYLPQFFVQNKNNKAYTNSNDLKILIKNMNAKLIDLRFNQFYKEYKTDDTSLKQDIDNKLQHIHEL